MTPCLACLARATPRTDDEDDTDAADDEDETEAVQCAFVGRRLKDGSGFGSGVGRVHGERGTSPLNVGLRDAKTLVRLAGPTLHGYLRRELAWVGEETVHVLPPIDDTGRVRCDGCSGALLSIRCGRLFLRPRCRRLANPRRALQVGVRGMRPRSLPRVHERAGSHRCAPRSLAGHGDAAPVDLFAVCRVSRGSASGPHSVRRRREIARSTARRTGRSWRRISSSISIPAPAAAARATSVLGTRRRHRALGCAASRPSLRPTCGGYAVVWSGCWPGRWPVPTRPLRRRQGQTASASCG